MLRHNRSPLMAAVIVVTLAGTVTGMAAASHVGPFAALGGSSQPVGVTTTMPALPADDLYPPATEPQPTQKVVDVPEEPSPDDRPSASPSPQPTANPTPSPCWSDACEGGDDGGGDGGGGSSGGDN